MRVRAPNLACVTGESQPPTRWHQTYVHPPCLALLSGCGPMPMLVLVVSSHLGNHNYPRYSLLQHIALSLKAYSTFEALAVTQVHSIV